MEQPAVTEVPELSSRSLLGQGLVEHQATGKFGVEDPNAGH